LWLLIVVVEEGCWFMRFFNIVAEVERRFWLSIFVSAEEGGWLRWLGIEEG
jgi:hypothetical protein